jgi:putative ABC transport system ATP-binding protein
MDMPDGLNTELWTGGAPLSLGQANRLMLARALVSSPKLLILDETLDHMDSDIRETVLPAVMGTRSPWTLIVVTHSDEVVKLCDRVIRLDGHGHVTIETQNPVKLEWPRKPLLDHN